MTFYQAMVNRFVIPVIEAHKAEGREEGRTEGRTEVMEEWRAWNERRLAVEREGRQFDETLPGVMTHPVRHSPGETSVSNQQTPPKHGTRGMPTLMLCRNGEVEATKLGALSKPQLTAFLDSNI